MRWRRSSAWPGRGGCRLPGRHRLRGERDAPLRARRAGSRRRAFRRPRNLPGSRYRDGRVLLRAAQRAMRQWLSLRSHLQLRRRRPRRGAMQLDRSVRPWFDVRDVRDVSGQGADGTSCAIGRRLSARALQQASTDPMRALRLPSHPVANRAFALEVRDPQASADPPESKRTSQPRQGLCACLKLGPWRRAAIQASSSSRRSFSAPDRSRRRRLLQTTDSAVAVEIYELGSPPAPRSRHGGGADGGTRTRSRSRSPPTTTSDAIAVLDYLARVPQCTGKLGVMMGICVGGLPVAGRPSPQVLLQA